MRTPSNRYIGTERIALVGNRYTNVSWLNSRNVAALVERVAFAAQKQNRAIPARDVELVLRLSRAASQLGTLAKLEARAREQGVTLDAAAREVVRRGRAGDLPPALPSGADFLERFVALL